MNQFRSKAEQLNDLEKELGQLRDELKRVKQSEEETVRQYRLLKVQNDRLLRMEAQHQNAKKSLLEKRIIFSHAVILLPESIVIGDRLENCTLKLYRGNNLTLTDTAELINCRIVGMEHYPDGALYKATRPVGTIDIRGIFYNTQPRRFAISTFERVVIQTGVRFRGNIRAGSIVISELTKVRGRIASRELLDQLFSSVLERNLKEETRLRIENRR
jgi:regulator of replication initiation timing